MTGTLAKYLDRKQDFCDKVLPDVHAGMFITPDRGSYEPNDITPFLHQRTGGFVLRWFTT